MARRAKPQRRSFASGIPPSVPDLTGLGGLAVTAAQCYGAVLLLVFAFQRRLLFLPHPHIADPAVTGGEVIVVPDPSGGGAGDAAALFFPPPDGAAPVVVYFHGNADQLGWGPAHLGPKFRACGLGFLAVEYPGYGVAGGRPSEASVTEHAQRILQHFVEERGLAQSRLVLFGQSLGAAAAVEMALQGHGARLVLVSPFTSIEDMACSAYPFLAPAVRAVPSLVRDRFDNRAKLPMLGLPILVMHGRRDEVVPFEHGETLASLGKGARFLPIEDAGHNDVLSVGGALGDVIAFARGSEA